MNAVIEQSKVLVHRAREVHVMPSGMVLMIQVVVMLQPSIRYSDFAYCYIFYFIFFIIIIIIDQLRLNVGLLKSLMNKI